MPEEIESDGISKEEKDLLAELGVSIADASAAAHQNFADAGAGFVKTPLPEGYMNDAASGGAKAGGGEKQLSIGQLPKKEKVSYGEVAAATLVGQGSAGAVVTAGDDRRDPKDEKTRRYNEANKFALAELAKKKESQADGDLDRRGSNSDDDDLIRSGGAAGDETGGKPAPLTPAKGKKPVPPKTPRAEDEDERKRLALPTGDEHFNEEDEEARIIASFAAFSDIGGSKKGRPQEPSYKQQPLGAMDEEPWPKSEPFVPNDEDNDDGDNDGAKSSDPKQAQGKGNGKGAAGKPGGNLGKGPRADAGKVDYGEVVKATADTGAVVAADKNQRVGPAASQTDPKVLFGPKKPREEQF